MTASIRRKLDQASSQLASQESSQRASHEAILQDLAAIQQRAVDVWAKLDESTKRILTAHEHALEQYSVTAKVHTR